MTINKYTGASREEAIENAKKDLGPNVVILNIKEIRPSGLFGFLKKSTWEVSGAVEEDRAGGLNRNTSGNHFNAVAGEKGIVEKNDTPFRKMNNQPALVSAPVKDEKVSEERDVNAENLRDAFREVSDIIRTGTVPVAQTAPKSQSSNLLKEKARVKQENTLDRDVRNEQELPVNVIADDDKPMDNRQLVRTLYQVLLKNEVEERDVNQILQDMQKILQSGSNNIDLLLSNVYQKMVLMLGKPHPITLSARKPTVVFLIGPTGVGKTTTIAKIASRFKLTEGRDIAMLTADTYRIAATEQLQTYANILEVPLEVVMAGDDINERIRKFADKDLILVDTAGFSHKNAEQKEAMKNLLDSVDPTYTKDVYLVLSATTRFGDMKAIIDSYKEFTDFHLIFTKLDETSVYGPIFSSKLYADADLSYVTQGQNVPDDMEVIDIQKIVKTLLGGR